MKAEDNPITNPSPVTRGSGIDQRNQNIHGPQTNVAGDQHVHYHGDAAPFTAPRRGRCDFYQHVRLPPNYVVREDLLAELRDALLQSETSIALTSSLLQADALFGMGGIGKTVMARALCDDAAVRVAFPEGILWATLGQTPDLMARLREWIRALGGAVPQTAPTLEELTNTLAQNLAGRRCLLIVDDVWEQGQLECFLVHVAGCHLLFTTRNAEIAKEIEATIRPVPIMSRQEAIALLVEWAGASAAHISPAQQTAIVERLGRLPLAIKLAGDQLQRRDPEKWLASFEARTLRKHHPKNIHDSLETTFDLSLSDLIDIERQLYISLSIFKEDEAVSFAAVAKLWSALAGYSADDTTDLLHYLADRALLELTAVDDEDGPTGEDRTLTATFHDLLRDLMRTELATEGRHAGHLAILSTYRRTRRSGDWSTAPNDGYLYDHLVYHLSEVAARDRIAYQELLDLFANHKWLHVRVPAAGYRYDGYIADLQTTWNIYQQHEYSEERAEGGIESLLRDMHFALLRTSLNSLAANYEPSLIGYAVELGLWPVARAVSIFEQTPEPNHKAQLGCALLVTNKLTEAEYAHVLQRSLEIAWTIPSMADRLRALIFLSDQLPDDKQLALLSQMIALVRDLKPEWLRVRALRLLTQRINSLHYDELLNAIITLEDDFQRLKAAILFAVSARGMSPETARSLSDMFFKNYNNLHAVMILHQISHGWRIVDRAFVALLKSLFEASHSGKVSDLLMGLTSQLRGAQKEQALQQALAAALAIEDEGRRAAVLRTLAPQLSGAQKEQALQEALAAAVAIEDEGLRAAVLRTLAPQLTSEQTLQQALAAALAIEDEELRGDVLRTLAPQLTSEQTLQQALAAAVAIEDEGRRAEVLRTLAPQLTSEQTLQQALAAAVAIEDEGRRAAVLHTLAPQLTSEQTLGQALAAALIIENEGRRAEVLRTLAPQLSGAQVLAAALAIEDEGRRAAVLRTLAPQLTSEQALRQALAATLAIKDEGRRAVVLRTLAPQLSGEQKQQALQQALAATLTIKNEGRRADMLRTLAPQLTSEQTLQQALAAAVAIEDEGLRADVLRTLAPQLTSEQALRQALAAAVAIEDEGLRADVLRTLAPQLTSEQALRQALAATLTIEDEGQRAAVLRTLAPQLSGAQVLAAALAIEDEELRGDVLRTLAPQLSGAQKEQALQQALAAALTLQPEGRRSQKLKTLLPQGSSGSKTQALIHLLESALVSVDETVRTDSMLWVIPYLTEFPSPDYCRIVLDTQGEWLRADLIEMTLPYVDVATQRALAEYLPSIPDQLNRRKISQIVGKQPERPSVEQVLNTAIAIKDGFHRARLYSVLSKCLYAQEQTLLINRVIKELDKLDSQLDLAATQLRLVYCQESDARTQLQTRAIQLAVAIVDSAERISALASLCTQLEPDEKRDVLAQIESTLREVADVDERARILNQLLRDRNRAGRRNLADIALGHALDSYDLELKVELLCALVPLLENNLQRIATRETLKEAKEVQGAEPRARAFAAVLPYLQGDERIAAFQRAMSATHAIENEMTRFTIFVKMTEADRDRRAFTAAKSIALSLNDHGLQAEAIALLLPFANSLERTALLRRGLIAALKVEEQSERAVSLAKYIPYVKNTQPILKEICLSVAQNMRAQAERSKRADLLDYLANDSLLHSTQLPDKVVIAMADAVSEICNEWVWL